VARVILAGGGYAGIQIAVGVLTPGCQVLLVDRSPVHQLITRLPEVVGGGVAPQRCGIPYDAFLPRCVQRIEAEITGIDPLRREVRTENGTYQADSLAVTLGSEIEDLGIDGVHDHAFALKSIDDAVRLRDCLRELSARKGQVRVTIVGAGYTSTEVAGQLSDPGVRSLASGTRVTVTVVSPESRLLIEANERVSTIAEATLRRKGVTFRFNTPVERVHAGEVQLAGGETLPSDITVWAMTTRAVSVVQRAWNSNGKRLPVDPYLRSPAMTGVYLAGDIALAHDYRNDRVVPASAQMAVQEGAVVARNIAADLQRTRPRDFRPVFLGEALALGGSDGVAEVGGLVFTGRRALAIKRAALARYVASLGGVRLVRHYAL
jgi:NADH:ubiquinone reductase (H+-translocating)